MPICNRQDIAWDSLNFSYLDTACHIRHVWRDGSWSAGELHEEPYVQLHVAATALHYGQACFEGLKVFECRDGRVRAFRPEMNARRMQSSARRLCMAPVPEELFLEALRRVVRANASYIPPYGSNGSLYVRPVLFGSGPRIGVHPADEYVFAVLVLPVGPYYKGGLQPVRAIVLDDYDRAAPHGLGNVKAGGNYAAGLEPHLLAQKMGFPIELYLDPREHRQVEEFGTSNFVAITKDNRFVTVESSSVLPSITNMSLQQLAADLGMAVEVRPVGFEEIGEFAEVAACGTAVVITPVNEIVRGDTVIQVGPRQGCGPLLQKLYERVTAIQCGEADDQHGWMQEIPLD